MRKLKKALAHVHHTLCSFQHHKAVHHGHHIVYLIYYGFTLLDDHGVKAFAVSTLVAFNVLHLLTGEE